MRQGLNNGLELEDVEDDGNNNHRNSKSHRRNPFILNNKNHANYDNNDDKLTPEQLAAMLSDYDSDDAEL